MTEATRQEINRRKCAELTESGNFKAKVEAVLKNMECQAFRPYITEALRTKERQAVLVRKGYSKTMNSRHLAGKDGKARAVDVVDAEVLWQAPREFFIMLGRLAMTQGCVWGGLWGLKGATRERFERFLMDQGKPFDPRAWEGPIGWDPAHIEQKLNWRGKPV